jgi:uncharacterized protein YaaR (DUF327 family)
MEKVKQKYNVLNYKINKKKHFLIFFYFKNNRKMCHVTRIKQFYSQHCPNGSTLNYEKNYQNTKKTDSSEKVTKIRMGLPDEIFVFNRKS